MALRRDHVAGEPHRKNDAEYILEVLHATRRWEEGAERNTVVKPLRELLWAVWEAPRLPKDRVRGKYPKSFLWSDLAREAVDADPACRLVLDHLTPASVVVRRLLDRTPATAAGLVRILRRDLDYGVITPAENRALRNAGVGARLAPGEKDPWGRYRHAGMQPDRWRSYA